MWCIRFLFFICFIFCCVYLKQSKLDKKKLYLKGCAEQPYLLGSLNVSLPPFFFPTQCSLKPWSQAEAIKCLKGRRIFLVGNSIARFFSYEAWSSFYNGTVTSKTEQKQECASNPCIFPIPEEANVSLAFLWAHRLGTGLPWCSEAFYEPLGYPRAPKLVLEEFLAQSAPGDILITYMGLQYVYVWGEWKALQTTGNLHYARGCSSDFKDALRALNNEEEFAQMTADDTASWVKSVQASWAGKTEHIFRVRLAPAGNYPYTDNWAHKIGWFNEILDENTQNTGWSVVDQYAINQGDAWDSWYKEESRPPFPPHYSDNIHFPGVLSIVTWEIILGKMCGNSKPL